MKNIYEYYKTLAKTKQLKRYHIIEYAILRALNKPDVTIEDAVKYADRLIRKAFKPITRKSKLDNGREQYDTMVKSLNSGCGYFSDIDLDDKKLISFRDILYHLRQKYLVDNKTKYTRKYVYIFVRQDIYPEYQLVQAAHVAAKMGHRLGVKDGQKLNGSEEPSTYQFDDLYFTVVGVPSELALLKAKEDLDSRGHEVFVFREPDIGNQITAIASSPVLMAERKGLMAYKKLKFNV